MRVDDNDQRVFPLRSSVGVCGVCYLKIDASQIEIHLLSAQAWLVVTIYDPFQIVKIMEAEAQRPQATV